MFLEFFEVGKVRCYLDEMANSDQPINAKAIGFNEDTLFQDST